MDTLVDLAKAAAKKYARNRAIVTDQGATDFAAFDAITDKVAASLITRGAKPGDRIGLYGINSDSFAFAYFGILKAGATVVPLNLLLNPKEISYILGDAGASGLVYHEAMAKAVESVQFSGFRVQCAEITKNQDPITKDIAPAELAAIIYTSGTTGKPKGAMLTHRNLASNVASIGAALRLEPGKDVLLVVLPMFHAFAATVGMLFPLLNGCTFVPVPKFDPQLVADLVERHGVTVLPMVPSMYNVLLRLPDAAVPKFKSLKYAVSGGAAMPAEVMKQFEAKFGKLIYEGDGPTECSPCTCVNPIGGVRKVNSVGTCIPDVDMEIRDDQGRELPRKEIGEICVRGPNVMKGYWNHPDETREAFFGEWFRTGDLGYEDEDGYFFIVDRKKDMIIVNGMNVYPRVVEEILYTHPAVREAAVVGEPDKLHGEVPVAFVSFKEGQAARPGDLRAFCLDHLGRHEVPRKFTILQELPKNAAGKILKRELRKSGELERGVNL